MEIQSKFGSFVFGFNSLDVPIVHHDVLIFVVDSRHGFHYLATVAVQLREGLSELLYYFEDWLDGLDWVGLSAVSKNV